MKTRIALAILSFIACVHAHAGPGYYLISIYENEGEKSIDFRFWNVAPHNAKSSYAPEIGFGYGVTKRWYTEVLAGWLHTAQSGTRFNDFAWQNDYLLTQGQYSFDLALHSEVKRFRDSSQGYGVEFGPALQTEFGRTQVNANLFFDRSYRSAQANPMQLKYQWQLRHRWRPAFQFGLQGFGELGEWDDWAPRRQQSHRSGPVVAGTMHLGKTQALKYEFAYLAGKVFATPAKTFVMRVQYEF
ncbi:MAG TPA: hypothetical protein VEC35_22950 [Noviherbaspirillum sp.]|nr:hypothetical protein [Noviherbaspirillum sp.]